MNFGAVNSPAAAFLAGLVTSIHCAGMCGPLACSLVAARARGGDDADTQVVASAYHVSRLAAYAVLGGVGGAIGAAPLTWISQTAWRWVPWFFVLVFVALAFRWDRFLPKVGALGRWTWKLQTWTRGRSRVTAAVALGGATPLLPCGPLYFIVALALLSGSAVRGVELMLAFGFGTVPLLWLAQTEFEWVRRRLSPLWLNRTRVTMALMSAALIAWRLRGTLGLAGPDPSTFLCH